jgi:hypothetical protein
VLSVAAEALLYADLVVTGSPGQAGR